MYSKIVLVALFCALVHSWTYVPVSDFNMVKTSDLIIYGKVMEQLSEAPVDVNRTYEYFKIQNDQVLFEEHGELPMEVIVRTHGGYNANTGESTHYPGSPSLEIGDKVVLFLKKHPSANGIFDINHFGLGAFHEIVGEASNANESPVSYAYRVSDAQDHSDTLRIRKLDNFLTFIRYVAKINDVAQSAIGRIAPFVRDYTATIDSNLFNMMEQSRSELHSRYNTMKTSKGQGVRWRAFDAGGSVSWYSSPSGTPPLSGGGVTEIQQAFSAWNNAPDCVIRYNYVGTSTASGGLSGGSDGVNAVLYEDPNSEISGSYNCNTGGTLAIGGWKSRGYSFTWRGATWLQIDEADIVVQDGISCWMTRSGSNASKNWANMLTHEFGHTLAMGHSCGDSATGTCTSGSDANNAIMRAYLQNGMGPVLQRDDKAGIRSLYATCFPNCPAL